MGRLILYEKPTDRQVKQYDLKFIKTVYDPYRDWEDYIYEGEILPKWERGQRPSAYCDLDTYLMMHIFPKVYEYASR